MRRALAWMPSNRSLAPSRANSAKEPRGGDGCGADASTKKKRKKISPRRMLDKLSTSFRYNNHNRDSSGRSSTSRSYYFGEESMKFMEDDNMMMKNACSTLIKFSETVTVRQCPSTPLTDDEIAAYWYDSFELDEMMHEAKFVASLHATYGHLSVDENKYPQRGLESLIITNTNNRNNVFTPAGRTVKQAKAAVFKEQRIYASKRRSSFSEGGGGVSPSKCSSRIATAYSMFTHGPAINACRMAMFDEITAKFFFDKDDNDGGGSNEEAEAQQKLQSRRRLLHSKHRDTECEDGDNNYVQKFGLCPFVGGGRAFFAPLVVLAGVTMGEYVMIAGLLYLLYVGGGASSTTTTTI